MACNSIFSMCRRVLRPRADVASVGVVAQQRRALSSKSSKAKKLPTPPPEAPPHATTPAVKHATHVSPTALAVEEALGADVAVPFHRAIGPLPDGIAVRMSETAARKMIELEAESAASLAEPREVGPNGESMYTLSELIDLYAEDSLQLLNHKPQDVDDATWIKGVEDLQARLEVQYEQIIQETNVILATPEWKEYRRVCDETVERLQDEFIKDPAPVCARTIADFHRKVDDAVNALQTFYRNKLATRVELEESTDLASLTDREREERLAAIAQASTDIALDLTRGELKSRHRHWGDLITGDRIKQLRATAKKENLELNRKLIEQRLLDGETLRAIKTDYPMLSVKDIMRVRGELCDKYPDKLHKRSYRQELEMMDATEQEKQHISTVPGGSAARKAAAAAAGAAREAAKEAERKAPKADEKAKK